MRRALFARALSVFFAASTVSAVVACNAAQRAAKDDPMKCERDPKCDKKRTRIADCSAQCSDDPACMDRCDMIQEQTGGARLGH